MTSAAPTTWRTTRCIDRGWELTSTPPGSATHPDQLDLAQVAWRPAAVPGTVAGALGLGLDDAPDYDAHDWWFRCSLPPTPGDGARLTLRLEGLATLAEVWLDGRLLLASDNMFRAHKVDVTDQLGAGAVLCIRLRSIAHALTARRVRPRWKTRLVDHQDLRWLRTSLLGRMPSWSPRSPVVGPWRPVVLERHAHVAVHSLSVQPDAPGGRPRLQVGATLEPLPGVTLHHARIEVDGLPAPLPVELVQLDARVQVQATAVLPDLALWWPHTHGTPTLHTARLVVDTSTGELVEPLGELGFRAVSFDIQAGRLTVNGTDVFCRGACWTPEHPHQPDGTPDDADATVQRAVAGGLNMLRIGGTMVPASPGLRRAADRHGVLLWHDLMLAALDYPLDDPGFRAELDTEVLELCATLGSHPSTAVVCGGSEVAQQAAMLGVALAPEQAAWFDHHLPALVHRHLPGVPCVPHSPVGGTLPFHTRAGVAHYFGVGAYRRPLTDARRAGVRFASECLALAHVPCSEALAELRHGAAVPPHDPAWKVGVPRDSSTGWDFEDVRDHYLRELFGDDPVALRSTDLERYLARSRAVSAELLTRVFAEWRRPGSGTGGGLVWTLRDLRPGAGWGLLDSARRPKAAWWGLRRAWAPVAVLLTDEGLDGYDVHVLNEGPEPLSAVLELTCLRGARHCVGRAELPLQIAAHGSHTLGAEAVLGGFFDLTYAYRFGPPRQDVVAAVLREASSGALLSQDVVFPTGHALRTHDSGVLEAEGTAHADGSVVLELRAQAFVQGLTFESRGYEPDDDHLHVLPDQPRQVRFVPTVEARRGFKAVLSALNLDGTVTVRVR